MPEVVAKIGPLRIRLEWDGRRHVAREAKVISYQGCFLVGFPGDWDIVDGNKQPIGQGYPNKRKAQNAIKRHLAGLK